MRAWAASTYSMPTASSGLRGNISGYLLATLIAVAGLGARQLFDPYVGVRNPYHFAWLTVVVAAWYLGLGPSILTLLIESLGVWYFFLTPLRGFRLYDRPTILGLIGFVILSGMVIALGEANRRSDARRVAAEDEILARKRAEESLREVSGRLLQLQDEERRHIGRELHDSVGQSFAAVKLGLDTLRSQIEAKCNDSEREILAQCGEMVSDGLKEVRTMSYLLHPPMLEEMGLATAVSWYVEGFAKRTGIQATAEIQNQFGRLPQELEMALFRVLQESLTNVHRHSRSLTARVCLQRQHGLVTLQITDEGTGMPMPAADRNGNEALATLGVGLRGMTERMRQLGGQLEVQRLERGTRIRATAPDADGTNPSKQTTSGTVTTRG